MIEKRESGQNTARPYPLTGGSSAARAGLPRRLPEGSRCSWPGPAEPSVSGTATLERWFGGPSAFYFTEKLILFSFFFPPGTPHCALSVLSFRLRGRAVSLLRCKSRCQCLSFSLITSPVTAVFGTGSHLECLRWRRLVGMVCLFAACPSFLPSRAGEVMRMQVIYRSFLQVSFFLRPPEVGILEPHFSCLENVV